MRIHKVLSLCASLGKQCRGMCAWAIVGGVVCGAGAGLFGLLFGILDGLLHLDFMRLLSADVHYFAICGVVAGVLTGASARLIDPEGVADLTNSEPWLRSPWRLVLLEVDSPKNSLGTQLFFEISLPSDDSRLKPSLK